MRKLLSATILLACASSLGQAQTIINMGGPNGPPSLPGQAGERKQAFTANFQLSLPMSAVEASEDMTKALLSANSSMYQVVNQECDTLTHTIAATCRLVNLTSNNNFNRRDNNGIVVVSANATYELTLKAVPARQ